MPDTAPGQGGEAHGKTWHAGLHQAKKPVANTLWIVLFCFYANLH